MHVERHTPRATAPLLIALVTVCLIVTGIKFDGLPYIPGARFSDTATSHWGSALFLQRSIMREHEFPFWRETILGGQPFYANPLNKTAYPLQYLALILPPALHINLMILLHLAIAGVGMWLLARALGLGAWAAGVSVIAYMLSPRMIAHTGAGHIDIVYALAWLPCLLWAVKCAADGSRRGLWLSGMFAGLMFLADVRLSLFGLALAVGYGVAHQPHPPAPSPLGEGEGADASPRSKWRGDLEVRFRLTRFLLPAFLFVLIAAAVIVPLALWSAHLTRAALTPVEAGVFSLQPEYLLGVVFPQSHGNPEVLTYLGIVPLILALIGVVTARRRVLFWVIAALIAGWYALGSNGLLWNALTQIAPVLLWFRVPSRAWLIVMLVIALLAGYGADRLKNRPLQIGVLIAVALELILTGRSWLEWRGADYWLPASQRALAEYLIADDVYRVYSPTYSLEQQVAEQYEIKLFYGVDPFQLRSYVGRIQHFSGVQSDSYSIIQPPLLGMLGDDLATANRDAHLNIVGGLEDPGVSHVIAAYPIEDSRLRLLDIVEGVYVYRNTSYRLEWVSDWRHWWYDDAPAYFGLLSALLTLIAGLTLLWGMWRAVRAKS